MIALPAIIAGGMSLLVAFAISVVLTPVVRFWALRNNFVDRPGLLDHKRHARPVCLGGGIAITAAILLPMVVGFLAAFLLHRAGPDQLAFLTAKVPMWRHYVGGVVMKIPEGLAIIGGALVMLLVGILDDRRPMSPGAKFISQIFVALVLAAGFGIRSGDAWGTVPAIVITVLWIATIINAFNFMDNMDGLASGVAAISAIVLAVTAFGSGQLFVPCLTLLLAGAVLGFLVYNFPPASIFMGDAGSLVVGYFMAVCAVLTTYYDPQCYQRQAGVLVPLVVFAIPLYDISSVVIRRIWQGVNIFKGDRRHFSHRLVAIGKSTRMALLTICLATMATAMPAILLPRLSWPAAMLIFVQCLCVVAIIAILESRDA